VIWEPFHNKLAIHTLAKRQIEAGKKDYTLDAQRNGVDIYEMLDDPIKGFVTKTIGFLSSEKVVGFQWSGVETSSTCLRMKAARTPSLST
jgi:hypothetical protein